MHATSGATVAAAGVGLLRDLTEGRGRASIWITLEGLDLEASAALLFPSRATGARGFHIWWGGVAGGVRAEAEGKKVHNNYTQTFKSSWPSVLQRSKFLIMMYYFR